MKMSQWQFSRMRTNAVVLMTADLWSQDFFLFFLFAYATVAAFFHDLL